MQVGKKTALRHFLGVLCASSPGKPMASSPHHPTLAADRIALRQKIAYGLGAIVTIVAVNSVVQLTSLVYVVGLGISAIWIG